MALEGWLVFMKGWHKQNDDDIQKKKEGGSLSLLSRRREAAKQRSIEWERACVLL